MGVKKRVNGDLKLLIIQKLVGDMRLARNKFSAQFSKLEQLIQQYRYRALPRE
jgi:hypothetical protein